MIPEHAKMPDMRIAKDFHNIPETITIGGKTINTRSKIERRLAQYFELLKQSNHIKDWAFEQTTFHFPDDTYLVDFDILNNDGTFEYYEAKGMFDGRSRRKLRLLNKYKPEVKLTMVFYNKKDIKKMGLCKTYCHRICLLSELTRGVV